MTTDSYVRLPSTPDRNRGPGYHWNPGRNGGVNNFDDSILMRPEYVQLGRQIR